MAPPTPSPAPRLRRGDRKAELLRAKLVAPALNAQDGPHTGQSYHIDSANNVLFMFCSPDHVGQHAQRLWRELDF